MFAVIYKIVGPEENKVYIGSTVMPLKKRLNNHRSDARKDVPMRLYDAMRAFGVNEFMIEEIVRVPIEQRYAAEGEHIRLNNAHAAGYNALIPGRTDLERRRIWRAANPELIRAQRQRRTARIAERRLVVAAPATPDDFHP